MATERSYWMNIKCPFFCSDTVCSIYCEGCEPTSFIRQQFANKNERWEWQKRYCFRIKEYSDCPIFEIVNRKYK